MEQLGSQVEVEVEAEAEAPEAVRLVDDDFVQFELAGTAATGEFRCTDCGYGAVIQRVLPLCPMCGGGIWEVRGPRFVS